MYNHKKYTLSQTTQTTQTTGIEEARETLQTIDNLSEQLEELTPIFFYGTILRNPDLIQEIFGQKKNLKSDTALNVKKVRVADKDNPLNETAPETLVISTNSTTKGMVTYLTQIELEKLTQWENDSNLDYKLQPIQMQSGIKAHAFIMPVPHDQIQYPSEPIKHSTSNSIYNWYKLSQLQ